MVARAPAGRGTASARESAAAGLGADIGELAVPRVASSAQVHGWGLGMHGTRGPGGRRTAVAAGHGTTHMAIAACSCAACGLQAWSGGPTVEKRC